MKNTGIALALILSCYMGVSMAATTDMINLGYDLGNFLQGACQASQDNQDDYSTDCSLSC